MVGRINRPLGLLDAGVQGGGGVARQDRHGSLGDDRAGVNALVHEVNGGPGEFHAVFQRLFPGLQAAETPAAAPDGC